MDILRSLQSSIGATEIRRSIFPTLCEMLIPVTSSAWRARAGISRRACCLSQSSTTALGATALALPTLTSTFLIVPVKLLSPLA